MGSTSVEKGCWQGVLLTYQIINQLQHETATYQQSAIASTTTAVLHFSHSI